MHQLHQRLIRRLDCIGGFPLGASGRRSLGAGSSAASVCAAGDACLTGIGRIWRVRTHRTPAAQNL